MDPEHVQKLNLKVSFASGGNTDPHEFPIPKEHEVSPESGGASMVEYALLAALIAAVCIISLTFLGGEASDTFSKVGSGFSASPN